MPHVLAALLALSLLVVSPGPVSAQQEVAPVFDSYEDMRGTLDTLMSKRRIADLLVAFGGGDEMSPQDMAALEAQVRNIYPGDFDSNALMMRKEMQNGFNQDLIAYWSGTGYIYVRVLWHARPSGDVIAINMTFNSDPDVLIPLF